jgi:hypothetical protein
MARIPENLPIYCPNERCFALVCVMNDTTIPDDETPAEPPTTQPTEPADPPVDPSDHLATDIQKIEDLPDQGTLPDGTPLKTAAASVSA